MSDDGQSDDHQELVAKFLDMWIGDTSEGAEPIDKVEIHALHEEHKIPEELMPVLVRVLEITARAYRREMERVQIDNSARRKDLARLEKAASRLSSLLDSMPTDTWQVVNEYRLALEVADNSVKDTAMSAAVSAMATESANAQTRQRETRSVSNLEVLRLELTELTAMFHGARKWMGEGKPGRPQDHSAISIMQMCFMIWTGVLGREFTLAWYKNNPDSDAARFCVDVARMVAPKLSVSRIITSARIAREEGITIKDLEIISANAEGFRN